MIGIIQKVLLDLLEETGGKPLLGAVLKRAEVPENVTFRIDQNYSDDEFHRLLQASSDETGLSEDELSHHITKVYACNICERILKPHNNEKDMVQSMIQHLKE